MSLSVGLSLCFSRPVWSGPCVIGAELAALRRNVDADTDAVPTEERSRACGRIGHGQRQRGERAHRTRRYLAGSKIATPFVLYGAPRVLPSSAGPRSRSRSWSWSCSASWSSCGRFLLLLSVRTALAAGSRAPPGNSAGRPTDPHFSVARALASPRLRRRSLFVDRFPLCPHSVTSCAPRISGCGEPAALAARLGRVDTAPIAPDNPENSARSAFRSRLSPISRFPFPP